MLKLSIPNPQEIEGKDVSAALRGKSLPTRALYWHYPHYANQGSKPAGALREGDWKLIEHFENNKLELFDLQTDPGEQRDLAAKQPKRVRAMHAKLTAWRARTGAAMPTTK